MSAQPMRRAGKRSGPGRPPLVALTVLLAVAVLAGCLGGPGGEGRPSPTSSSATSSTPAPSPSLTPAQPAPLVLELLPAFAMEPCRGISVQSTQAADNVQALLPEGFKAVPGPTGGQGTAILGVDLYQCGNLTTANARIANPYYGQVYTYIDRPTARLADAPEASVQEYVFRVLAGNDVLGQLWPAAGYETRSGTPALAIGPVSNGLPVDVPQRLGNGSIGPDYQLLATGTAAALPLSASGTFARYTALADGSVLVWTGSYSFPQPYGGPGTFSVADDDPFAGFEFGGSVSGVFSRLYEQGGMLGMDLRRFFPPPPAP